MCGAGRRADRDEIIGKAPDKLSEWMGHAENVGKPDDSADNDWTLNMSPEAERHTHAVLWRSDARDVAGKVA